MAAANLDFGMERTVLKSLLNRSKSEPVNCAIGKGKEAGAAYILMDKTKQPKALESVLQKQFADLKDARRGTAFVDTDDNPKLVVFRLNRPTSGLAIRMVKLLRPVGFSKVRFDFEDGSDSEEVGSEEEEEAGPAAPLARPAQAPPDAKALKDRLTALVQRIGPAIAADPSSKDALMGLAKQAQAEIASDPAKAGATIDTLEAKLGHGGAAAPKPAEAAGTGVVAYAKSRLAWLGVRKRMELDLGTLRAKMLEHYADEDIAAFLEARYAERVAPVLAALDERLADTLDDATNATDPAKRKALADESREIIKGYQAFMASEPVFAEIDSNPFVPLAFVKTMTATLATLAAAVK